MREELMNTASEWISDSLYDIRWEALYAAILYTMWAFSGFLMEIA